MLTVTHSLQAHIAKFNAYNMNAHMHANTHAHTHTDPHMHTHSHTHMRARAHTHTHTHACTHAHTLSVWVSLPLSLSLSLSHMSHTHTHQMHISSMCQSPIYSTWWPYSVTFSLALFGCSLVRKSETETKWHGYWNICPIWSTLRCGMFKSCLDCTDSQTLYNYNPNCY